MFRSDKETFLQLKGAVKKYRDAILSYDLLGREKCLKEKRNAFELFLSLFTKDIQEIVANSALTNRLLEMDPFSAENIAFDDVQLADFYCCLEKPEERSQYLKTIDTMLCFKHPDLDALQGILAGKHNNIKTTVLNIFLAAYDPYTGIEHGKIFEKMVSMFIRALNESETIPLENKLPPRVQTLTRYGARVHDIGKLLVHLMILNKMGSHEEIEDQLMKRHPLYGIIVLAKYGIKNPIINDIAGHHHEKYQGGGYPDQLELDGIDKYTRIISILDYFDACASHRMYRPSSIPRGLIIERLQNSEMFDQNYVNVLLEEKTGLAKKLYALSSDYER
jgi:response regulator RpfG family c-di-GMP phosphodiesterase